MATLGMITVDVQDEQAAAAWWLKQLKSEYLAQYPEFTMLSLPGTPLRLGFQKVANPTEGKNRIHLDLEAENDRATEVAKFLAAGASLIEEHGGADEFSWSVLRDPFGLVFCISDPH